MSTAPSSKPTHWKQTIALLPDALTNDQNPTVKEDDKFECYVIMNQSDDNVRNYVIDIGLNLLEEANGEEESESDEDDGEEHPMPCDRDCKRMKCILIKATLERYEQEKSNDTAI